MKAFMDKDFLLETETAKQLYHQHAAKMPIVDYHCHINPQEIAEDKHYATITELWLGADHYKWRNLRANGVPE
ncbi:MAG: glucuronate isomerase, partial [Ruthenibacterium sp.]